MQTTYIVGTVSLSSVAKNDKQSVRIDDNLMEYGYLHCLW